MCNGDCSACKSSLGPTTVVLYAEQYENSSLKDKNDKIARHLGGILELMVDEQESFKDKYHATLYFKDESGKRRYKVKTTYQITDLNQIG